jgi:bacteriocin biosynthesis cyclodehydratase domain-containing protein
MGFRALEFSVLGIGHLAAAVRTQLPLLGLSPREDCTGVSHVRQLVLACSDYPGTSSFADANRRALSERCAILFAWICGDCIEVGPLVLPRVTPCFECHSMRLRDFSLNETTSRCVSPPRPTLNPDTQLESTAQFGALLVARELAALRLGACDLRLVGRVAKFDPPCFQPRLTAVVRRPDCPACGFAQH